MNTEAIQELAEMIKNGNITAKINDHYKQLTQNPKLLISLQNEASDRMNTSLIERMIDVPIGNDLSFTDKSGNQIHIADFIGKTIVIDCWATWCAPCIGALPAMEKLAEKYQENPDVVFLFLNTQDSRGRKRAVELFSKNYSGLNLLFDEANVAGAFLGVSGLPTKLVIDRNQHIRFRHVGLSGSMQQQMDELSAMIEVSQKN